MEKVYHKPTQSIHDLTQELKQEIKDKGNVKEYAKILALPEHFSNKHLQAIVDGKMKDEDEVLVKCFLYGEKLIGGTIGEHPKYKDYKVHLNQQNQITLFPAQQSLEEAIKQFRKQEGLVEISDGTHLIDTVKSAIKFGVEWAKKNNY